MHLLSYMDRQVLDSTYRLKMDTNRIFTSLFSKSHNSIWKHMCTATIIKKNFKQIHAKFELTEIS